MVGSRTATAFAGLVLSLAVSIVAWVQYDTLLLFLLVPFVPLLFRRGRGAAGSESGAAGAPAGPPRKRCPTCGFETRAPDYAHCPRDGTALE